MGRLLIAVAAICTVSSGVWAQPAKPAVEIRLQPIGELAPIIQYGGELFGQADAGKQFAAILQQFSGDAKGFEGVDLNRPIGAYLRLATDLEASTFVVLVPVADSEAVIGAISGKLGLDPRKGDDGVYNLDVPNVPGTVYIRFADNYAYVTLRDEKAVDPKSVIPAKTFFAQKSPGVLNAAVNFDAIPTDMKQMAVSHLEMRVKDEQSKLAANPTQKMLNEFFANVGIDAAKTALMDGAKLALTFDVDPKSDDWKLQIGMSAVSGSTLEKTLAGLADRESVAAGVAMVEAAAGRQVLNFKLPPETAAKFATLVDKVAKQATADAKDSDRAAAQLFADAIVPTLKAGDFQLGVRLDSQPGDKPSVSFAMKTVSGEKFGDVATVMAIGIPASAGSFQSNADIIDAGKLHKLTVADPATSPFASDTVWFLTSADLLAGATESKPDLLKKMAQAKPAKAPMMLTQVSLTAVAAMAENNLSSERLQEIVKEVFGGDTKGRDTLQIRASGGKAFDLTLSMKGKGIAFMAAIDQAKKQ